MNMKFIEPLIELPVLPASMLLALLAAWSVLAILGGTTFHGHHLSIDSDADISDAVSSMGSLTFRWLGLSEMPLIIWLSVFSLLWWTVSITLWKSVDMYFFSHPGLGWSTLLVARNLAITLPLTKLLTRPMRGWFISEELTSQSLVGQECEICSSEATPEYGQARFKTDGSPLLLNVRTDGSYLAKGDRVWITHYDAQRRAYIVSSTSAR